MSLKYKKDKISQRALRELCPLCTSG